MQSTETTGHLTMTRLFKNATIRNSKQSAPKISHYPKG